MLIALLVVLLLVMVNACYVAAEFSTVSVRRSRIAEMAEEGNHWLARRLLPVLGDPLRLDRYISASQIGITLSSLTLGAFSQATITPSLAALLEGQFGMVRATALSTATLVVLVLITVTQVVFGELLPKSLALQFPVQVALGAVLPMQWSLVVYRPFLKVLNGSGLLILRALGFPAAGHQHVHSPEEIEILIGESRKGGLLHDREDQRLRRGLKLANRPVRHLMVPRANIAGIAVDATPEQVRQAFAEHRYTRLPVYRGSPDQVVGILHTKDLAVEVARSGQIPAVESVMRPVVSIPHAATSDRLVALFREKQTHQALVVDEFGVTGLVTLGDLLAELLGDSASRSRTGQPEPRQLADGRVRLPGRLRVDEAREWVRLPWSAGRAVTVGGRVVEELGRVPRPGERVEVEGITVDIERVANNAVASVLVTPPGPEAADEEEVRG